MLESRLDAEWILSCLVEYRPKSMPTLRICALTALAVLPLPMPAQWLGYPTPGIPRTRDGKPNLAAPTPRGRDGKPDLSGLWLTEPAPAELRARLIPDGTNGAGEEPLSQYFINIFSDFEPGKEPVRPQAAAALQDRAAVFSRVSPIAHCLPEGMPLVEIAPAPYKIIQDPGRTVMLYERDTTYRQIYTDGRKLPVDPSPTWLGYSVGRWDGDTFVVESNGFNDRSWLDARGHTHSEALHLTERFHRINFGTMLLDLSFDDPQTYTRPFSVRIKQHLVPDSDLLESFCAENEKDAGHEVAR
jgi:hypothetical protein